MNPRPAGDYSLYLVTDRTLARGRPLVEIVEESLKGGVTIVQLREKHCTAREFLELAMTLKTTLSFHDRPFIINDRVDVALACGAQGVHVGQDDLECSVIKRIAGRNFIVGVSVSTVEEALKAQGQGADYLGVSPVFSTPTKWDTPAATGLSGLQSIRGAVTLPLVAIGGMGPHNAGEAIRHGADGIAVVSAIMGAPDPRKAARKMKEAVATALGRRRTSEI